jgi:group I intron endonuclease
MYKKVTGVYAIEAVGSDWRYIGSAVCIKGRLNMHKRELEAGKHSNKLMQRVFDKYGEFIYRVIEECPRDVLRVREQFYIDTDGGMLMNLDRTVCELAPPEVHSKRMMKAWESRSDKAKADMGIKISNTLKQRYRDNPTELARSRSNLEKGRSSEAFKRNHQSEKANALRSAAMKDFWSHRADEMGSKISEGMAKKACHQIVCYHCGKKHVGTERQKYCSPKCRSAAFHLRAKLKHGDDIVCSTVKAGEA